MADVDETSGRTSLRTRITKRVLTVSLVPLLLLGGFATVLVRGLSGDAAAEVEASKQRLVDDFVGPDLLLRAEIVAGEIDAFLAGEIARARVWTTNPAVVEAARLAAVAARDGGLLDLEVDELEARFPDDVPRTLGVSAAADRYVADRVAESDHFAEIFFTDANGFNAAISNQTGDFVQAGEDWWEAAMADGIAIGDVDFDDSAGTFSVDVSVRIDDPFTDRPLGVMKSVLAVTVFQSLADGASAQVDAGDVVVATADGRLLAETATAHAADRIFTDGVSLEDATGGLLTASVSTAGGAVVDDEIALGHARTAGSEHYADVADGFDGLDLRVAILRPTEVALAPLAGLDELESGIADASNLVTLLALLALAVAAGGASVVAIRISNAITRPILQLRDVAEQVSMGDLDCEVEVASDDEIGELAESFDRLVMSVKFLSMTADDTLEL